MFAGLLAEVGTNSKVPTTCHLRYRFYPVLLCLEINTALVRKFKVGTAYFTYSFPHLCLPKWIHFQDPQLTSADYAFLSITCISHHYLHFKVPRPLFEANNLYHHQIRILYNFYEKDEYEKPGNFLKSVVLSPHRHSLAHRHKMTIATHVACVCAQPFAIVYASAVYAVSEELKTLFTIHIGSHVPSNAASVYISYKLYAQ
jgi:hypothetical protein